MFIYQRSGKVEIGYPRIIASTWHGIPEQASAAVTFNNDLYFFDANRAYKFHTVNMTASPAIDISHLWRFCPVAMKISCGTHAPRISSIIYLQSLLLPLLLFTESVVISHCSPSHFLCYF
ncbi:unnamed protein product [Gongylonema pulchrum]|uniref:Uncharacterized protein n=1 Tax=Gongylonema pulchrum TaxID=637853 RepID=A0A3P6PV52_9BILA|nr:unnamed protein product [Gongylonema pulchrum]